MKFMIASDIHGSAYWTKRLVARWKEERPDRVILLGDLLYHGPRNDLPRDYAPKQVIPMLSKYQDKIIAVRGNCEAEVDQMVLDFPVLSDYAVLPLGDRVIYATHGHHGSEQTPPPLCPGDILLCGHTHVPSCRDHGDFLYLNPGSVSIPKNGSRHSYMTLENGELLWKDVETGEVWDRHTL